MKTLSEQEIENQVIDENDFNHIDDIHESVDENIITNIKNYEKRKAFPKKKTVISEIDATIAEDATIIQETKSKKTQISKIKRNILIGSLIIATGASIAISEHLKDENKNILEIILNEIQNTK